MKGNLQGEPRQGLLLDKLLATFWESNSRCHNFCSTAFTFLARLETSTLTKSVPLPLGWSRCGGLSVKSLARKPLTPFPRHFILTWHFHFSLCWVPGCGFHLWPGKGERPNCRAMIMIADSPLTRLCPFSHPHLPSCRDHSNPRNFAHSYSMPMRTDPSFSLHIATGGRFSDGETRDERVTRCPGCNQGPKNLTFLTRLLSALWRACTRNHAPSRKHPHLLSAPSGAHLL